MAAVAPRVRFAPSPTGYLHVGGARTALFNWLYARRHGGTFVLRIEDTDVERSSADMVTGILDGLRWLGLDWDEGPDAGGPYGPYFQSQWLDRYRRAAARLVSSGHAYSCYCTPERLQAEREKAEQRGEAWQYDRVCLTLAPERINELEQEGAPRAIRFKVPAAGTAFVDAVHGRIAFDGTNIEDFVILRSDGHPTYHLSVVADDIDMAITHVIRGDRSHLEHPEARAAVRSDRSADAAVRPRAADSRRGQEAFEQAARRDIGYGVPARGISARGHDELSGAAGLVPWRRS